mgnify:CR=1 FL=1
MCYIQNIKNNNVLFKVKCSINTKHNCIIKNITVDCTIIVEAYSSNKKIKLGLRQKNLNIIKDFEKYEDFLNYEERVEDFNVNYEVKLMIKSLLNDQYVISFKNN